MLNRWLVSPVVMEVPKNILNYCTNAKIGSEEQAIGRGAMGSMKGLGNHDE